MPCLADRLLLPCLCLVLLSGLVGTSQLPVSPAIRPTPVKASYPQVVFPHAKNVSIIVDEDLWSHLHQLISRYADLVTAEHWNVHLEHGSWSSAQELRNHLIELHEEINIDGVLLVGDLPSARFEEEPATSFLYPESYICDHWYEGKPPTIPVYHFPTEIFFADLDGKWLDTTSLPAGAGGGEPNDIYDSHTDPDGEGPADLGPEIWVARVVAPSNITYYTKSRLEVIDDFFHRACKYHEGLLVQEDRVLIDANAFPSDIDDYSEVAELLWSQEDQVHLRGSIPDQSTNERWVSEIQNSYIHAIAEVHGGGCCYGQEFIECDQGETYCDYLFYHELRDVEAHVAFYFLDTCKVANFTHPNSMILWYLLGKGKAIVAMGSSTDHGPTDLTDVYGELAAGKTVGEGLYTFLKAKNMSYTLSGHANTMLFGDPFYRIRNGLTVAEPVFSIMPLLPPSPSYTYSVITVTASQDGSPLTTADAAQYLIIDGSDTIIATGELSWTGKEWQSSPLLSPPLGQYRLRCIFEANGLRGISPDTEIVIQGIPLPIIVPIFLTVIVIIIIPWWWKHSRSAGARLSPKAGP